MKLKLVRHHLPSYPELGNVIKEEVPIGTEYEILGFYPDQTFYNSDIDRSITIDTYKVIREGTHKGFLPVEVFAD